MSAKALLDNFSHHPRTLVDIANPRSCRRRAESESVVVVSRYNTPQVDIKRSKYGGGAVECAELGLEMRVLHKPP